MVIASYIALAGDVWRITGRYLRSLQLPEERVLPEGLQPCESSQDPTLWTYLSPGNSSVVA